MSDPQLISIDAGQMVRWANHWLDTGTPGEGMPTPEIVTLATTVLVFAWRAVSNDPTSCVESFELSHSWIATLVNIAIAIVHHEQLASGDSWRDRALDHVVFLVSAMLKNEPPERGPELLIELRMMSAR